MQTSKGKTLLKLQSKGFNVPYLILVKEKDFIKNSNNVLRHISNKFNKLIAIRSSASNEDTEKSAFVKRRKC